MDIEINTFDGIKLKTANTYVETDINLSVSDKAFEEILYDGEVENGTLGANRLASVLDKSITEVTKSDLQGVTSIGVYAFYSCKSLTKVTIPTSVTNIGNWAFNYCNELTNFVFEDNSQVQTIGSLAFASCKKLQSITIPSSVTSIGGDAFNSCSSLTNITIPASVTSLGDQVFYACSNLTSVVFEEGCRIPKMGNYLFWSCNNLESVNIPNNVTEIGGNTFASYKMTSLIIPASVTKIGPQTFRIGSKTNKATIRFLGTTPPSIQSNTFISMDNYEKIIVPKGCREVYLNPTNTNWVNLADQVTIEEATE